MGCFQSSILKSRSSFGSSLTFTKHFYFEFRWPSGSWASSALAADLGSTAWTYELFLGLSSYFLFQLVFGLLRHQKSLALYDKTCQMCNSRKEIAWYLEEMWLCPYGYVGDIGRHYFLIIDLGSTWRVLDKATSILFLRLTAPLSGKILQDHPKCIARMFHIRYHPWAGRAQMICHPCWLHAPLVDHFHYFELQNFHLMVCASKYLQEHPWYHRLSSRCSWLPLRCWWWRLFI